MSNVRPNLSQRYIPDLSTFSYVTNRVFETAIFGIETMWYEIRVVKIQQRDQNFFTEMERYEISVPENERDTKRFQLRISENTTGNGTTL